MTTATSSKAKPHNRDRRRRLAHPHPHRPAHNRTLMAILFHRPPYSGYPRIRRQRSQRSRRINHSSLKGTD